MHPLDRHADRSQGRIRVNPSPSPMAAIDSLELLGASAAAVSRAERLPSSVSDVAWLRRSVLGRFAGSSMPRLC
jgi:hypothetical protein